MKLICPWRYSTTSFERCLATRRLAEADLVVHEAGYGVHTPLERLAELPADVRGRMRLAHFPDPLDLTACGIEPLEQGRCYVV